MKGKRMFWGVALLAVLTLMACIATFSILAGSFQGEVILLNFALNIPFCIFIGYADYKIVSFLHKRQKNTDALSIVANVIAFQSDNRHRVPHLLSHKLFHHALQAKWYIATPVARDTIEQHDSAYHRSVLLQQPVSCKQSPAGSG